MLIQQDNHPARKTTHLPGLSSMDGLGVLGLRSNPSDEKAVTEALDCSRELAEVDQGKDVSASGQHSQADAKAHDSMESFARHGANTSTVYLNLGFNSLKLATVKLMDPLKRCMVAPDTPGTYLIEEVRSTKNVGLPKLLEHHLEMVELKEYLPFNVMLLVAHGTTSLFQNIKSDGLTFSSLPYEVKGLKMVTRQQNFALHGPQNARGSRFSETAIQDCSTASLKDRGIRQLRFHKRSSKHDWQCFIDLSDSKYRTMFGDSEPLFFERVMAATVELFEHGQTIHKGRPLRSDQVQQYETIARAMYVQQVDRKRIALESWGQYLASMDAPRCLVSRTRQSELDVFRELQKEYAGSKPKQQLAGETNANIPGTTLRDTLDIESGNEASDEEETDLDRVEVESGKGATSIVDLRDRGQGTDINVYMTSGNAQRKRKGKAVRKRKEPHRNCNTPSLVPRPAGNSTDEDDVAASKKSGSFAFSKQQSPFNTAKKLDSALSSANVYASQSSSHNIGTLHTTASSPGEAGEMDDLSGRVSEIALEGDRERVDEDRSRRKDSAEEDGDWQTVVQKKPRKFVNEKSSLPRSLPRGDARAATNPASTARRGVPAKDLLISEPPPLSYPANAASVAPALSAQEFPSLPTTTQSKEAIKKVMAKKKKKKEKRKKRQSALESESSQSSSTPTASGQELITAMHSQLFRNIGRQDALERQGHSSDGPAQITDEEITPNASMINLVAASASLPCSTPIPPLSRAVRTSTTLVPSAASGSQPSSLSVPPSAMESQLAFTTAPSSAGTGQSRLVSAPLPITRPTATLVHKFGALDGPTSIVCRMPGCEITTSPWDGSTTICPSCGPYSSIRYCCIDHLLADTTDHWGLDCMKYTCHHLCDASTIHPRQIQCPPAIPNLCGWNSPERHRQAVYHAHSSKKNGFAEVQGDYFIFTDAAEWIQAGSPNMEAWGLHRARGTLLLVVTFDDERSPNSLKDRFNRLMNIALFTSASNTPLLDHMFLMIRENLLSKGKWDDSVLDSVVYQFLWEFSYHLPDWITNNLRHACPYQWFGTPLDARTTVEHCQDRICNREQLQTSTRHLLGPRLVLKEKAEGLERRYWILRVAHVYHPDVPDPAQRMRGVGYSFMAPENQRQFGMGREWDGFPGGMMEVEGAIWVSNSNGPPRLQVPNITTLTV